MNEIKIDKIDNFKKFVAEMEVNTKYLLPDNCRYKWAKVEKTVDHYCRKIYFIWAMEYNYSNSKMVGYIFPMSGSNKITQFKTESGAKRNFLKRYSNYFESIALTDLL